MICKICGSRECSVIYNDVIRNGGIGKFTKQNIQMYQCKKCNVIWHEPIFDNINEFYESKEYRDSLGEGITVADYYRNSDKDILQKLTYTGTGIFRNKNIADIGCGAGTFLDFLKGVGEKLIAIEPSEIYQKALKEKGYFTYSYLSDACKEWKNKIDIVTSFDVIEHVEDPLQFMKEIYDLLVCRGGSRAIIGTPTDAPVMRHLLGSQYEKQVLFSVQHLWIFSEQSLLILAEKAGFKNVRIQYFQRYDMANLLGWCLNKTPNSNLEVPFFENELNAIWKSVCDTKKMSDFIVLYANKE